MKPLHPSLIPPQLPDDQVDHVCRTLAMGVWECRGISRGGITLFWDCLMNVIEYYKKLSWDDAYRLAQCLMSEIDPNEGNDFDTSMAFGDWYYVFRATVSKEFSGKYDDVIAIGMKCSNYPVWKLYLDDLRDPTDESFVIARTFTEAKELIRQFGIPLYISFDHDLGEDNEGNPLPSGYDLAKWIVEMDMDENTDLWIYSVFEFNVHSMNPVGAENIRHYLRNYLDFKEKNENWRGRKSPLLRW